MSLAADYQSLVRDRLADAEDASVLLPLALVQACVQVLAVDGAGLSLTQDLRVPPSASSDMVARAERLQITLGEGPCLSATDAGGPLIADLAAVTTKWPVFGAELVGQTPFRSVASLPLRLPGGDRLGAVDLYSRDEGGLPFATIPDVGMEMADLMATNLLGTSGWLGDDDDLGWRDTHVAAARRLDVWVAVGMVIGATSMTNVDALAVLRAYAFAHGLSLDDLAVLLTSRRLAVQALLE